VSFRTRVTIAAGCAVLVAILATSGAVYVLVERNLRGQVDRALQSFGGPMVSQQMFERFDPAEITGRSDTGLDTLFDDRYVQVVDAEGAVVWALPGRELPTTAAVLEVAQGERSDAFLDTEVAGDSVRVYVRPMLDGGAVLVGQSLDDVDTSLRQLVVALAAISAMALGIAALVGRFVAAAAVAPVQRLSEAAEAVAQTGDLSQHIPVSGRDELGRLAASFNTMLDALDASLSRQRQLVADASHELRTPLASVRTNVEVLARGDELAPDDLARLRHDIVAQIVELTRLVDDLVELAREDHDHEPVTVFALDRVVAKVVGSAERRHPEAHFELTLVPGSVRGTPSRVERAVSNLVDNAVKWSPPDAPIEVAVVDGTVAVCDRGPGIDPVDLPHIFDRFYRSVTARRLPGSGLGLAIVKQVADDHDGTVTVHARTGGGSRFELRLPAAPG
jgi:two-component system sensor histidine kinase MprB